MSFVSRQNDDFAVHLEHPLKHQQTLRSGLAVRVVNEVFAIQEHGELIVLCHL